MAKKQLQRKITVKSPKMGGTYYFRFAGSVLQGTIIDKCESLRKHYNEKYYTFLSDGTTKGIFNKYPVSIRDIGSNINDVKY